MNDATAEEAYADSVEGVCALVDHVLREATGEAPPDTTPETELLLSGLLDSLTIMKIVTVVESAYGIALAERAIVAANFRTPQTLWRAIQAEAHTQDGSIGVRG
ncbi:MULTISPECIES: phosphopantetheine-binding protein [unclassified Streptomyces]|uniref:phosphopantetheine-binding protein n=1 Tax=unclassified Streptomyces TaxID=2593676 RepID=UPI002E2918C2|nr:phosphopantetheine-binding protein [Streptomyces sp. NBC_00690]